MIPTAYRLRLLGYLSRTWHGEPAALDDLLQETLLRAVRYMRVFPDEDCFWSWLTVLARSAVGDHGRKRARWWKLLRRWRLEAQLRAIVGEPDEFGDQLETAMSQLDQEGRELLEAKYYRRASVRALAERHQLTEKAVEGRLSRARHQLAKLLSKRDS